MLLAFQVPIAVWSLAAQAFVWLDDTRRVCASRNGRFLVLPLVHETNRNQAGSDSSKSMFESVGAVLERVGRRAQKV